MDNQMQAQPQKTAEPGGSLTRIVRPVRVTEINQTCTACPSQWEGKTEDARQIYVRYRWGYLSVRVSEPHDAKEFAGVRGREIFGAQLNDGLHGFLDYEQLQLATRGVIEWPNEKVSSGETNQ